MTKEVPAVTYTCIHFVEVLQIESPTGPHPYSKGQIHIESVKISQQTNRWAGCMVRARAPPPAASMSSIHGCNCVDGVRLDLCLDYPGTQLYTFSSNRLYLYRMSRTSMYESGAAILVHKTMPAPGYAVYPVCSGLSE